jgi:hypothetical protein
MYVNELLDKVTIISTSTCVYPRANSFITSAPTRRYFDKYRAPVHSTRLLQQSLKVAAREYVSWTCFCSPDVWSPMMATLTYTWPTNSASKFHSFTVPTWLYWSLQQIYQQSHDRERGISPLWCSFVINTHNDGRHTINVIYCATVFHTQ